MEFTETPMEHTQLVVAQAFWGNINVVVAIVPGKVR